MAEEITAKKIENLSENTEPVDTDVFLFGSSGSNTIKKIKWSNIAKKLKSILFANNLTTTAEGYGLDARQGKILKGEIDELNTKIGDFQILSIQEIWMDVPSTAAGAQTTATANITAVPGATQYFVCIKQHGWLTPSTVTISGTTLSCVFLNASSGTHSGNAVFDVLAAKSV